MSIFADYPYRRMVWLLIGLLVSLGSALAQAEEYYQPNSKTNQPGYWRLSTSLDQRSTIVSFFDHQDQLLYQETLSGYHLRPSQRTTDLLDDVLNRLVTNQLVSAQLQGQLVPFPLIKHRFQRNSDSGRPDSTSVGEKDKIHCSINPDGIIRLNVLNPTAEPLEIRLTDEQGWTIYSNVTRQSEYYSRLNVSSLVNGSFRLSISGGGKVLYSFRLTKSTQAHFELQATAEDTYATIRRP